MLVAARRTLACLLGVALLALVPPAGAQSPPEYTPAVLTPAQLRTDIAVLRASLEELHAGYDRYVPRRLLDSAFARLDRRAVGGMTEVEFYRETALLLARIRCNHTKAEYPKAIEVYRTTHATHLPVRVRIFGARMFVAAGALPRGDELLAINGIPADSVIRRLSRYAAVDGFTDFARTALLERDDDLMGSDLDHYWPIEFAMPTMWTLRVRSVTGAERVETLAPITFAASRALTGDPSPLDFGNGTRLTMLDRATALLTVRSFVNYRTPLDADSLYAALFAEIARRGATALLIDLRGNGGGSDDASWGLARQLVRAPLPALNAVRRRTIRIGEALQPYIDTWGNRAATFTPPESLFARAADGWFDERGGARTITPAAPGFSGRVSVLVDAHVGSGTAMLVAVLQREGARSGRLRVIGEATGGSAAGPTAGQILFVRLPESGIRVRVPLKRSVVAVASIPGFGVFPEIDATPTLAEWRAQRDVALDAARRAPWGAPAAGLSATLGTLSGELEYRNYQDGRRVRIPTQLVTTRVRDDATRVLQHTIYDDGPGNTIYSADEIRVAGDRWFEPNGSAVDTLRIVSRRRVPDGTEWVLRGTGEDDDKPVEFRYTVTIGRDHYRRLKEFRQPGTTAWEYRHEYRFVRSR